LAQLEYKVAQLEFENRIRELEDRIKELQELIQQKQYQRSDSEECGGRNLNPELQKARPSHRGIADTSL